MISIKVNNMTPFMMERSVEMIPFLPETKLGWFMTKPKCNI